MYRRGRGAGTQAAASDGPELGGAALNAAASGLWLAVLLAACSGAGPRGVGEPAAGAIPKDDPRSFQPPPPRPPGAVQSRSVKRIREAPPEPQRAESAPVEPGAGALGVFRNTYYNFPSARNYRGRLVPVFDADCQPLARVPVTFHDTLCVQGSGSLATGATVSFARRGCHCARTCPRTGQQICFDELDREAFPWGRGAAGTAIVPLRSVAVDVAVIPLGTSLFIPEYVGLPLEPDGTTQHDGCFVAEDRGIQVRGKHVDIFTGAVEVTRLYNRLVPTNRGVTVYVDSPRCPRSK